MTARRHGSVQAGGRACAPVWAAVLLCLAALARAADTPERPPEAAACEACHGPLGHSADDTVPHLAGQKAGYLVNQLEAFKSGERKNDLMAAIAGQLDTPRMRALAAYWSLLPAAPHTPAQDAAPGRAQVAPRMTFPADLPNGFAVYQTLGDIDTGQVVKRHANAVALCAAREGKALPTGAMIIVATHELQRDAAQKPLLGADGQALAGKLLSYASMEARADWGAEVPALLRNGDWGYALFTADRLRRDAVNQLPCLACHKPIAADSHVFSLKAMAAAGVALPQ